MGEEKKETGLKQILGFWDLMGIGVGQIIGSGIMSLTGVCILMTGAGTPFAFLLAAALVMCPNIVLAVLGAAVPATGGMYTYVRDYIGRKTGFFYLALLTAGQLVLAMFAITFATYAGELIPGVNQTLVAFAILTLCYVFNILGVEMAAKLQKFLVVILMAAMAVFVAFGIPKVDWSTFDSMDKIMPDGIVGFLTGASLLTFATGGAEFLSELGGECKNPGRDLPKAIIWSTVVVAVIYAFIGVVATGVLPIEQVAGESLAAVAAAVLPKPLYVFFIVGGGMFAVATTLNGSFTWVTKGLLIASEEGWLPKKAAYIGKKGTPVVLLTVFYIIGAVPILTGLSLETISRLGNGLSLIYVLFPIATGYLIHKKNPEAMEKTTFKMGKKPLYVFTTIGLLSYIMAAYFNFADIQNAAALIAVYFAVVIAYAWIREKKVKELAGEK